VLPDLPEDEEDEVLAMDGKTSTRPLEVRPKEDWQLCNTVRPFGYTDRHSSQFAFAILSCLEPIRIDGDAPARTLRDLNLAVSHFQFRRK
jgi:hypothetical protein